MQHTFMINSGLNVPNPAIPIPAFDVPNAAPTAEESNMSGIRLFNFAQLLTAEYHLCIFRQNRVLWNAREL